MKFLRNTEIQLTKEENQKKNTIRYFFEKFQNRIKISCLPTLWVHNLRKLTRSIHFQK
jgi:hypothetical protein